MAPNKSSKIFLAFAETLTVIVCVVRDNFGPLAHFWLDDKFFLHWDDSQVWVHLGLAIDLKVFKFINLPALSRLSAKTISFASLLRLESA